MINLLKNHPFFADKTIESCTLLENQGYCNENYLVFANKIKYIVRKLLRDDIDRDFEWKVHHLAFERNITAEPFVFDRGNGFMIFEFLEGVHKEVASDLELLAITLKNVHDISVNANPITLHIKNKTQEVIQAFETIEKYPKDYVLCHNDLNPQNLLWLDGVKFIDWEHAGVNDRYFDLACICMEFELDEKMQTVFLDAYFLDDYELEKLEAYKVIYKILCEEWFETNFHKVK